MNGFSYTPTNRPFPIFPPQFYFACPIPTYPNPEWWSSIRRYSEPVCPPPNTIPRKVPVVTTWPPPFNQAQPYQPPYQVPISPKSSVVRHTQDVIVTRNGYFQPPPRPPSSSQEATNFSASLQMNNTNGNRQETVQRPTEPNTTRSSFSSTASTLISDSQIDPALRAMDYANYNMYQRRPSMPSSTYPEPPRFPHMILPNPSSTERLPLPLLPNIPPAPQVVRTSPKAPRLAGHIPQSERPRPPVSHTSITLPLLSMTNGTPTIPDLAPFPEIKIEEVEFLPPVDDDEEGACLTWDLMVPSQFGMLSQPQGGPRRKSDPTDLKSKPVASKRSPSKVPRRSKHQQRFRCEKCGEAFTRRNDLTRHARGHTNDRPYRCLGCDEGFTRKDKLNDHMKRDESCRTAVALSALIELKPVQCDATSFEGSMGS